MSLHQHTEEDGGTNGTNTTVSDHQIAPSGSSELCDNDTPDIALISFLCDKVLPNYHLNQSLLKNWQLELTASDAADNLPLIIGEHVVLGSNDNCSSIDFANFKLFNERLNALNSSIYEDLKVILLQIVIYVVTDSYNLRVRLFNIDFHHVLLDTFISIVRQMDSTIDKSNKDILIKTPVLDQYTRLIVLFLELGSDITYVKKIITPLFAERCTSSKLALLELFHLLLQNNPAHFKFAIFNTATSFPFTNNEIKKCLSIHSWFKINRRSQDIEEPVTLLTISNSGAHTIPHPITTLKVQLVAYNQFMVELDNSQSKARMRFTFNQILHENQPHGEDSNISNACCDRNQGYTHLVLTYDKYGNLNLFVNGEYSESIPCPDILKGLQAWNKITIGNECSSNIKCNDEILIKNLTVLNNNLSPEWISLLYNLGVAYEWDYKEFTRANLLNLVNHLSFRGLINVGIKFNKLQEQKTDSKIFANRKGEVGGTDVSWSPSRFTMKQFGHQTQVLSDRLSQARVIKNLNLSDKEVIVDSLSQLKQDMVLFDTNEFFQTFEKQQKYNQYSQEVQFLSYPSYVYHNSCPFNSSFHCIGGTALLLNQIESSIETKNPVMRDSMLYILFSTLFLTIENDWRLCKDFENANGYGLLSIILTNYKENHNPSLTLRLVDNLNRDKFMEEITGSKGYNLLNILLSHNGFDFINSYESLILNKLSYRYLILNFDLFLGTNSFEFLLSQLQVLIESSKYKSYNTMELRKMKLLKRFIQFLKNPELLSNQSESTMNQIKSTLECILKAETSVETIRTISTYIIFALYNEDCSTECGVIALTSLTNILCDKNSSIKTLKKFSRSITVHWILLLFNVKIPEVTQSGIRLLTKLLKSLGINIIKRFFKVNHGLEILTQFLKHWWKDDTILTSIFLAGFGVDAVGGIVTQDILKDEAHDLIEVLNELSAVLNKLIMPEFLILLTNIILNSMYTLNLRCGRLLSSNPASPTKSKTEENMELKLDVLHVINEYIESIRIGYGKIPALNQFYITRDFLEGLFELLAYLKLSLHWSDDETKERFSSSYNNLVNVLSDIFISQLTKNLVVEIFDTLSDLTKKLMLDLIFPKIFEHFNGFVSVSNFIYDQKNFLDSTISVLNCYLTEFVRQNFYISNENLDSFMTCQMVSIELAKGKQLTKEKSILGDLIVIKFLRLAEVYENSTIETDQLNSYLKSLLYRQVTVFQREVLDGRKLADIANLVLGILMQLPPEKQESTLEYTFSFLRTWYLMNQDDIAFITKSISSEPNLMIEFLNNLLSKNDQDTLSRLYKFPTLTKAITRNFQSLLSNHKRSEYLYLTDMISVMLHNGGKLGHMDSIYIRSFERDCESLKAQIIQGEVIKYNRAIQDQKENIQFFVAGYNLLKIEILRLVLNDGKNRNYTLDFIENHDRMRKRLILEDQLPESEKLSYNFTVPIKKLDSVETSDIVGHEDFDILTVEALDSLDISRDDGIEENEESYDLENNNNSSTNEESKVRINYEDRNRKVIRSLFMGDEISALWNVCEINGLVPVESLMILGTSHLYLIENYFHCSDGNVIDVVDAPNDLRDPILQLVNSQSSNVLKENKKSHRNKNWNLEKLSCISKRQFLLRDIALEMFFSDGASILITCLTTKDRDIIYNKLYQYVSGKGLDGELAQALHASTSLLSGSVSNGSSFFASKIVSAFSNNSFSSSLMSATRKWKMGELSNFYYLMIINTLAGRTFNDLSQYPVFPWVIADYESEVLDLSNPKTFRDLSKPMGAQTEPRAGQFKDRYEALASLEDDLSPAFHYGTHYSSAMIVTSYLIRLRPFVQSYLLLQGGKFDHADRLFNSLDRAWKSASQDNTTDVRELTPEFFFLPEFLVNSNNFEFGKLQNGEISNDVILPPWAKGDPKIFISKNREALESPYVSANLNLWIDLIFGFKQSGIDAVESLNVFHHLSYNGAINLDNINDEVEKRATIGMINNFGQTPTKIFTKPHPSREVLNSPGYYLNLVNVEDPPKLVFESKLQSPIEKLEISSKSNKKWVGRPSCIVADDELLIRKPINFRNESKSLIINQTTFLDLQLSNITYILQIGNKLFLTGSENGTINVWKVLFKPTMNLQYQTVLRGHFTTIKSVKYSKSFKVGISTDSEGIIIIWDFVRFEFIRKLAPPNEAIKQTFVSISDDSGNIAIGYSLANNFLVKLYTINGELILQKRFDFRPRAVTHLNFATINKPTVDDGKLVLINNHTYWANDIIGISIGKELKVFEIVVSQNGWSMNEIDSINLDKHLKGDITTFELFKNHEIDSEEKLCRGVLKLIVGDYTGRVYTLV